MSDQGPRVWIQDPRDEHLREVIRRFIEGGALTETATSGSKEGLALYWSLSLRMKELLGDALDGAEVDYSWDVGRKVSR